MNSQPPDEYAAEGRLLYGSADFVRAVEAFATAVDKMHTMYVVGNASYRRPSPADQGILDGLANSVGAALALNSQAPIRDSAGTALNYLVQIADFAARQGIDAEPYLQCARQLSRELG